MYYQIDDGKHKYVDHVQSKSQQKREEVFVISSTNAVINPWAVMIEFLQRKIGKYSSMTIIPYQKQQNNAIAVIRKVKRLAIFNQNSLMFEWCQH